MQRLRHRTQAAIAALVLAGSALGAIVANGSAAASAPAAAAGGPVVAGAKATIQRLVDEHTLSAAQGAAKGAAIGAGDRERDRQRLCRTPSSWSRTAS